VSEPEIETEAAAELKRIKAEIAAIEGHATSIWSHWAPWVMFMVGLILGALFWYGISA
jgi:hypothetical protein